MKSGIDTLSSEAHKDEEISRASSQPYLRYTVPDIAAKATSHLESADDQIESPGYNLGVGYGEEQWTNEENE